MAKRTCICFISLLIIISSRALSQDTVTVPLHIRAGFDFSGPVIKIINHDLISYGVLASADLKENFAVSAGLRYSSFSSSEYSYDFSSRGISFEAGADYNFMKPKTAQGKYYAGIGLRYGLSIYSEEIPRIIYSNPWGTGQMSLPLSHHLGHYLEITPGVRTELFPGVTIGWNLYMRLLISAGAGRDLKPVWMPGYGDATSGMTTGAEYYISISVPYKKIRVIIRPRPVETEEQEDEGSDNVTPAPASLSGGRL
jgi:hypothetical protein